LIWVFRLPGTAVEARVTWALVALLSGGAAVPIAAAGVGRPHQCGLL
jgi:hypothetical protein